MREHVLLIHGLAETSFWMKAAGAVLWLQGYITHNIDYPSTEKTIEDLTDEFLAPALADLSNVPVLHIVTHSMGGILLRHYLQKNKIPNLGRIVMLAPGNAGSRTMTAFKYHPLFPLILGPAGIQSTDDETCFACQLPDTINEETGIIAGCLPLDPVSWFTMPWPNDGKITVEATRLKGLKDHLVVAASHDTILTDPIALYQTAHFLKYGKFERL